MTGQHEPHWKPEVKSGAPEARPFNKKNPPFYVVVIVEIKAQERCEYTCYN